MGTKKQGKHLQLVQTNRIIAAQALPLCRLLLKFYCLALWIIFSKISSGNIVQGFDNYEHNLNVDMGFKRSRENIYN